MGAMDKLKDLLKIARQQGKTEEQIEEIVEQAAEKSTCIPPELKQQDGFRPDIVIMDEMSTYRRNDAVDALTYAAVTIPEGESIADRTAALFGIPSTVLCGIDMTAGFERFKSTFGAASIILMAGDSCKASLSSESRQQSNNYRRMHKLPMKRKQAMRRVDRHGETDGTDGHRKDIPLS